MKQLLIFIRKEFYHVLRDKKVLLILFGMPVAQVLLFGFALSSEIKDSRLIIVDYAKDYASQQITTKVEASRYFDVEKNVLTHEQIEASFQEGKIKAALVFPEHFQEDLARNNKPQVQIIVDATDINAGNRINNYLPAFIMDYNA